jgi:serine protease Do
MIISKDGDILTNSHVVRQADEIMVTLVDGRTFQCRLVGFDDLSDLAVIRIVDLDDTDDLPTVSLGDSEAVHPGQWAVAIGNPFGIAQPNAPQPPTVTVGVVSAVRSIDNGGRHYRDVIQTDAAINPGNSGGPLCNIDGEVIGINTFIVSGGAYQNAGIGFAIPVNRAKTVLADLQAGRDVQYGWLGVGIQDLTADLRDYFNVDKSGGVVVTSVQPNGPAEAAGIQRGDVIQSVNGKPVRGTRALVHAIASQPAGAEAAIAVSRTGNQFVVTATLGRRPRGDDDTADAAVTTIAADEPDDTRWRGARLVDLPADRARAGRSGVMVDDVTPDSPADRAGLKPGDIISEAGRHEVASLAEFYDAVEDLSDSVLVLTERGFQIVRPENEEE